MRWTRWRSASSSWRWTGCSTRTSVVSSMRWWRGRRGGD